ncbi:MAG: helicase-related protein, partial [Kaistella sp.]
DNRPLKFEEFEAMQNQVIYVSATPADYELEKTGGEYIEQIIRPTGLLDPIIEVRPTINQIDDLIEEIHKREEVDERVLVTTLTKKMAEELTRYFTKFGIRCRYIHSDVETLERIQIMQDLRTGLFDVLIGVNLLREGLDLPEVSLVAILDADKEGMLRSRRSMIQTVGRAARNINGRAIMYADKMTKSMQAAIDETNYRREKQTLYNSENNITPTQISKKISEALVGRAKDFPDEKYTQKEILKQVAEERASYGSEDIEKIIGEKQLAMEKAAKNLDFIKAAKLRDEISALKA